MDVQVLQRLSEMGPVAHLIALLCLFLIVLLKVWKTKREAFWPATLTGLIGILVGLGSWMAATRILGLKVLSQDDIAKIARRAQQQNRGNWNSNRRQQVYRQQNRNHAGQDRYQLAMVVRAIDSLTNRDLRFLNDKQAKEILSMLDIIMPKESIDDSEASEMVEHMVTLLDERQKLAIQMEPRPQNHGMWTGIGYLRENPFQAEVNANAVLALQKRYENLKRVTIVTPNLLDL